MTQYNYDNLLHHAQTRARQLDNVHLTTASVGLGVLGFAASAAFSEGIEFNGNTIVFGVVLAVTLPGSVLLGLVARPLIVPLPHEQTGAVREQRDSDFMLQCLMSTTSWNRMKRWCLASSWLGLLYLVTLLAGGATSETFETKLWLYGGLAAPVAFVFLCAFIRAIRLTYGTQSQKQKCLLRRGHLIDLDGYQPRNCCTTPNSYMTSTARRPTSETRCDTPETQ
ncbi:MAG: hypothetical protein OXH86_07675 [Acidimicrobiaceae bacterium]|nr:hypothetical protein [Acidimicrobiaceae bacterium]MDE0497217.1 hypothetical protein [Acidimicrobiaceae bacterium]